MKRYAITIVAFLIIQSCTEVKKFDPNLSESTEGSFVLSRGETKVLQECPYQSIQVVRVNGLEGSCDVLISKGSPSISREVHLNLGQRVPDISTTAGSPIITVFKIDNNSVRFYFEFKYLPASAIKGLR